MGGGGVTYANACAMVHVHVQSNRSVLMNIAVNDGPAPPPVPYAMLPSPRKGRQPPPHHHVTSPRPEPGRTSRGITTGVNSCECPVWSVATVHGLSGTTPGLYPAPPARQGEAAELACRELDRTATVGVWTGRTAKRPS